MLNKQLRKGARNKMVEMPTYGGQGADYRFGLMMQRQKIGELAAEVLAQEGKDLWKLRSAVMWLDMDLKPYWHQPIGLIGSKDEKKSYLEFKKELFKVFEDEDDKKPTDKENKKQPEQRFLIEFDRIKALYGLIMDLLQARNLLFMEETEHIIIADKEKYKGFTAEKAKKLLRKR